MLCKLFVKFGVLETVPISLLTGQLWAYFHSHDE